jgi:hypothetical protein
MAAAPLPAWSLRRSPRDCASFSDGVAMANALCLACCAVLHLAFYVEPLLAYCVERLLAFSAFFGAKARGHHDWPVKPVIHPWTSVGWKQ